MLLQQLSNLYVEQRPIESVLLKRYVIIDVYRPRSYDPAIPLSLLLINDGQNLAEMAFATILNGLIETGAIAPVICVGIHCNQDRIDEYGTAEPLDFAGRGKKAKAYQQFLVAELIPFLHREFAIDHFAQPAIAGFSMGGLSALDTLWNYPDVFSVAGVFSGSLWWRSRSLGEGYDDDSHRIMHQNIRRQKYLSGKRFYFTTGTLDETADRNNNGIIDSIDDTLDVIKELEGIGYDREKEILYFNDEAGRHDVQTWAKALPAFLCWLGEKRVSKSPSL